MLDKESPIFESTSKCIKIKDVKSGVIRPQDGELEELTAVFDIDQLNKYNDREKFSVGLVIKMNGTPIPLVVERLLE